jgi:RNA polymerase sigma-70 factor, ECF subfamily
MNARTQEVAAPAVGPQPGDAGDPARRDLDLMLQVSSGSVTAFETVVERHWASTVRYARHMVGDPDRASDIAQEAFTRLWQRRADWRPTGSVRIWLLRTARNLIASEARAEAVRARWAARAPWEPQTRPPSPLQETERTELREAINRALDSLSPRRREVFTLFHVQDLSYREIAEVMEIRPQTVANYLQAAIADMRESLAPYFPGLARKDLDDL